MKSISVFAAFCLTCFMLSNTVQATEISKGSLAGRIGSGIGAGFTKGFMAGLEDSRRLEALAMQETIRERARQQEVANQQYQIELMKEVIKNYDPSMRQEFIEYVTIDLQGHLSHENQVLLLTLLNMKA